MGWRMTVPADFTRELAAALRLGGTEGGLIRASDPAAPAIPVRFLLSHPSRRDEAIVNAYGVNALVITLPATKELLEAPPAKFDLIVLDGAKRYALDSVLLRQVGNRPVAFTCFVKGKGE
jgi:hypothetical protein